MISIVESGYSQTGRIKGRIIDKETRESLAFVHILVNNSRSGTTSDIDGRFSIHYSGQIKSLRLSYVGYVTQLLVITDHLNKNPKQSSDNLIIRLVRDTRVLKELVFEAGENPAHPIIRKVVDNRKINNPEKIKSFKYKSYNKFIIDAENIEDDDEEFQEFITSKYLFIMESVTERKFLRPDRSKETVIANRVAGFKNPLFTTLANSFQPFSFYGDYIKVAGKRYLNPISKGSTKKYFFELKDSIYSKGHKVYLIKFEPRKANFDGLKGILYISTYKYAIENVIAETANLFEHFNDNAKIEVTTNDESNNRGVGLDIEIEEDTTSLPETDTVQVKNSKNNDAFEQISITFKIQQKYDLIGDSLWFPLQLNTDITIGDASGNSDGALKGVGRSYLSDIELLAELKSREFDRAALEFDPKANRRDSVFWDQYRIEPITSRGLETYHFIDSVGEEEHFDRIITGFALLTTGKIRVGKINLDANEFLNFNRYESVRLGIGAHTNTLLSRFFNVGGYVAYGFRDKDFKYGGDINFFLTRKNEIKLSAIYQKDVSEFAGSKFYMDNNPLSSERNREFMIDNMDKYENKEAAISFYFLKYLDTRIAFSQSTKEVTTSYLYAIPDSETPVLTNKFDFTEIKLGFKYSFREKYIEVFGNKVSTGTKYPVIWVNYTRGLEGVAGGEFGYEKWDLKIQKTFTIKGLGQPTIAIKSGLTLGNLPATNLYNGNGSKAQWIPLEAVNSFQTMSLGEFLSDRYAAIYFSHSFGKVVINPKRSTPEFIIITNAAWGTLAHPERHLNYNFQTMEKGYYESGLSIRELYRIYSVIGLGVAGFYRYGPYANAETWDNISIKFSIKFSIRSL